MFSTLTKGTKAFSEGLGAVMVHRGWSVIYRQSNPAGRLCEMAIIYLFA